MKVSTLCLGCCRAFVLDRAALFHLSGYLTLALTLSKLDGETMLKQMRKTSV
jgi:hypothetical protein